MAIDKPGNDCPAAKLDDFRVPGNVRLNLRELANFFDALAFNPNSCVLDVSPFADIEQFSRFDQNSGECRCLSGGTERAEPQKKRDDERSCMHGRSSYHNPYRVNKLAFFDSVDRTSILPNFGPPPAPDLFPRATMAGLESTRGGNRSPR